jgi:hypothetical protein
MTMVMESDWHIRAAKTTRARKRLIAAGLLARRGAALGKGAHAIAASAFCIV